MRCAAGWALLLFLLTALPASAATIEPGAVDIRLARRSLPEWIRGALAAAPEMAVARAEVAVRERRLGAAQAARFLPEFHALSIGGIARRARGTVLEPLDSTSVNAYGPFTQVEVQFVQPLFTWGKITSSIEAAAHAVEAQLASGERTGNAIVEQAKDLYFNVLLARTLYGIVAETADGYDEALVTARERRDDGDTEITELDILYLRVGRAEIKKQLPRLQVGAEIALQALRILGGESRTAALDVAERFLDPVPATVRAISWYEEQLFEQSPDWQQLQFGIAAQARQRDALEADYYPSLFLSGTFAYAYAPRRQRQLNPFAFDRFNYLRGPGGVLGVRWPLNFHLTAARVAAAQAEVEKLQAESRRARSGLRLQLQEAYDGVTQARESLEVLEDGRKAGRTILTFAVTNFDIGIGDASEILQALGNYARVSSSYYDFVKQYDMALARLTRVTGEEVMHLEGITPGHRWEAPGLR
ncbi:MAG: TolC family protein [Deltaproteobacteria bacterium]